MGEKIFLTAEEARAKARDSSCLKNRAYKAIFESSKENYSELIWDVQGMCKEAVNDLKQDLRDRGYSADYFKDDDNNIDENTLIIKW